MELFTYFVLFHCGPLIARIWIIYIVSFVSSLCAHPSLSLLEMLLLCGLFGFLWLKIFLFLNDRLWSISGTSMEGLVLHHSNQVLLVLTHLFGVGSRKLGLVEAPSVS